MAARKSRVLRGLAAVAAACALSVAAACTAPPSAPGPHRVGSGGEGILNVALSPNAVVGANDWGCRPSADRPNPVVLVHATAMNMANWTTLSPMLANAGHCVFALNYGRLSPTDVLGGVRATESSAQELSDFVDRVLAATGADKVDIVGHSQGGMMPGYYIRFLGGADKVDTFVGLSPSNHGTTAGGLTAYMESLGLGETVRSGIEAAGMHGLTDQMAGSPLMDRLFGDGDTVPGPRYVVIQTRHDWLVTPYTNSFLDGPDVTNHLIQDYCPTDPVGHVSIFFDGPTMQLVLNELGDADPTFRPLCIGFGEAI